MIALPHFKEVANNLIMFATTAFPTYY